MEHGMRSHVEAVHSEPSHKAMTHTSKYRRHHGARGGLTLRPKITPVVNPGGVKGECEGKGEISQGSHNTRAWLDLLSPQTFTLYTGF